MLAATLVSVNAIGCATGRLPVPTSDPIAWTEYLGSATRAPSADEALAADLTAVWHTGATKAATGPAAVGGHIVAVLGFDRYLMLLDRDTGGQLWRQRLNAPGAGGPLLAGDRLYAATSGVEGRVYAVRLANGHSIWRREVGPVSPPLAATGDGIAAATEFGQVVGLAAADGTVRWRVRLRARVRSGLTPAAERLFVATDDSLFLVDPDSGRVVVRREALGATLAPPAVRGDTLLLASPDGFVAALDARDLTTFWQVHLAEPVLGSPVLTRDEVVVVTVPGTLWRIALADPSRRVVVHLDVPVRAAPAPIVGGVLIGTVRGDVLFAPTHSTEAIRRLHVSGPIEQPPVVRDGTLFVLDGVGGVHAWR